jgi:murein L,D-transpeptidase YafK
MIPSDRKRIEFARRRTSIGFVVAHLFVVALPFIVSPTSIADADEPEFADAILIEKSVRRLTLFANGAPLLSYPIALGAEPIGPKQEEGDERTPEGDYVIDARNEKSDFHLALRISYPNAQDRARAAVAGVDPGGDIMIHGIRNGLGWIGTFHNRVDWTDGCIAVSDLEMEQIWARVKLGTPVRITP